MNITAAAIRNDRVTILAILVVLFSGIAAYRVLPRAEDPGFTIRVALVEGWINRGKCMRARCPCKMCFRGTKIEVDRIRFPRDLLEGMNQSIADSYSSASIPP